MAGREKSKRKALHRGLDDIINRDASLTSRLLGRVKPPSREPLDAPATDESRRPEAENEAPAKSATIGLGEGSSPTLSDSISSQSTSAATELTASGAHTGESQAASEKRRSGDLLRVVEQPRTALPRVARDSAKTDSQSLTPGKSPPVNVIPSFDDFVGRWGFVLRSGGRAGKLRICEVLYQNTYAIGQKTFFTSYEKLAKLTNLEKKQCSINVRQLETLGFIERLNIFNTATRQGTEFKLHLDQLPPAERRAPQYHCYDEDLR